VRTPPGAVALPRAWSLFDPAVILMLRAFLAASGGFGRVTLSTPFSKRASTLPGSASKGTEMVRRTAP
jgi:hypothetical protein